jgi:outer membrane protein OmpA-like peptidoglycan-associated protein
MITNFRRMMKNKLILATTLLAIPTFAFSANASEYPFPTEMKVTIERGEEPVIKSKSSVVYPVINKFTVTMPNGDTGFVLETESRDELAMVRDGEEYLLQSSVALGENIFFGVDSQTAGRPVRVMVDGPINLGHIHFDSASAKLSVEGKMVLAEMAKQMYNSGLLGAYLVGMTDRAGSIDSNLALSQKRVSAASKYLSKKLAQLGATGTMIKTENMGEYLSSTKDGIVNFFDRKVSVLIYPNV